MVMRFSTILFAASAGLVGTGPAGEWNASGAASCSAVNGCVEKPVDEVAHLQVGRTRMKEDPRPIIKKTVCSISGEGSGLLSFSLSSGLMGQDTNDGNIVADFQVTGRECCGQGPITVYFVLNSIEEEISTQKLSNATAKKLADDVIVLLEKIGAGESQMGILSSKFVDDSLEIQAVTAAFEGDPMAYVWRLTITGPRGYAILTPLFFSTDVTHCNQGPV